MKSIAALLRFSFPRKPAPKLYQDIESNHEEIGNWISDNIRQASLIDALEYPGEISYETQPGASNFYVDLIFGPIDDHLIRNWRQFNQEITDYISSELEPTVVKVCRLRMSGGSEYLLVTHGDVTEEMFIGQE